MFSEKIQKIRNIALEKCQPYFEIPDKIAEINTLKVLDAMRKIKLSDAHFNTSSGYAYDDIGRAKVEELFAEVFKTEAALVRTQFVSGTHALATVLFGILRPNDTLVYLTGEPYDTMQTVIGDKTSSKGSLKEFGINYLQLDLVDGKVDIKNISNVIDKNTKMAVIQRSCGYTMRPSLTIDEIEEITASVKNINPDCIIFVDNCYGEFTDIKEPTEVGVDIMAGSLIKNPGGGLALTGGYIVGKKELVELSSYRLTSPGMGAELGASLANNRHIFQGFFMASHIVAQAVKAAIFAAAFFDELGYKTIPHYKDKRNDIIQAIELGKAEKLVAFCQGIQKYSPVDSYAAPEPWDMPGYSDKVIMAAGTFVQGASIELSADGPMREPYNVFMQGGLTLEHAIIATMGAAEMMEDK